MLNTIKSSIGVVGLAVMGANIARNFASKEYKTSVYNRTFARTQELVNEFPDHLDGFEELKDFVESLELPRKIIVMVKSGQPVDELIIELLKYVDQDDIIIDCGNSYWKDTQRRQEQLKHKVHFIGCGVSGGSLGALHGPSIMPGGEKHVVDQLLPYLRHVVAKDFLLNPCVSNIGEGAAGHFVKMVHNGIEYALMQSIAEIYNILRSNKYSNEHMRIVFSKLNQGNLQSYLLDITEDILESKIENGDYLLDLVLDKAESKGTGGWTVISAIELGVSIPSLSSALFARYANSQDHITTMIHPIYENLSSQDNLDSTIDEFSKILELNFFASYIQGFELIQKASDEYSWKVDIHEVLRVWEGGCIIRSQMISTLQSYIKLNKTLQIDFLTKYAQYIPKIRHFISQTRVSMATTNASLDYILTFLAPRLPTNLIQAQRDYFGEHTYVRIDSGDTVTGGWNKSKG
ncbi:MAG: NADP-dependent phosphogluconate dehydrogenase [candidate division SR1 bacterium]|nr:NADP-dependent phosphogluconate dehydrogenase [candidate division SR1 bacterium]